MQPKNCTVSNVFHDNCVVNWQPPDDDGGTEITGYIVEVNNEDEDIKMMIKITMMMLPNGSLLIMKDA